MSLDGARPLSHHASHISNRRWPEKRAEWVLRYLCIIQIGQVVSSFRQGLSRLVARWPACRPFRFGWSQPVGPLSRRKGLKDSNGASPSFADRPRTPQDKQVPGWHWGPVALIKTTWDWPFSWQGCNGYCRLNLSIVPSLCDPAWSFCL
jgi:hypothetical protein